MSPCTHIIEARFLFEIGPFLMWANLFQSIFFCLGKSRTYLNPQLRVVTAFTPRAFFLIIQMQRYNGF